MFARKTIAAGLVALTTLATAVPASAASLNLNFGQGGAQLTFHDGNRHGWDRHDRRQRTLSAQEVRRVLRDRGYRNINYVDRRGQVYQARATLNGRRFGLVISARNGAILNRYRIG